MNKKIVPPEHITKADEANRVLIDAAINAIPVVGGALSTVMRHALPSNRDNRTQEWHSEVSDRINNHTDQINKHAQRVEIVGLSVDGLEATVSALSEQVGQIAREDSAGDVAVDFYDGALEACRVLVDQRKLKTAFELLEGRLLGPPEVAPSQALRAAIVTLQGVCQFQLGEQERAASLFLEALALDRDSAKVRANAVVGYLVYERFDDAAKLLEGLLADDPSEPMHWANYLYMKGAEGASLECLDKVPITLRSAEKVMLAIIDVVRAQGYNAWRDRARETLLAHPTSRAAKRYAAEAVLEAAMETLQSTSAVPEEVSAARRQASEAAAELAELWTTLLDTEVPARKTHIELLQNAITGHRLAGEIDQALALAMPSVEELIAKEESRMTLAALALDANRGDWLIRLFEHSFEDKAAIQLEWAARNQDWAEALRVVQTFPEEISKQNEASPEDIAAILQVMTGAASDRAQGFSSLLSEDADQATSLFLARICRRADLYDLADRALRKAIDAGAPKSPELRHQLALEAAQNDWSDDVIDLLAGYVDPARDTPERRWLAFAYARTARPLQSGVAFFQRLRPHASTDAGLQRAGGQFEMARSKPRDAAPWFRRALGLEPGDARSILALWQALSRSGQSRAADRLLDEVDLGGLSGAASDQLNLTQLLWRKGRVEALDFAYELASMNQDDSATCLSYIGLMLLDATKADAPPIPLVTQVERGAWVRLSRTNGDPFSFVVADQSDAPRGHLGLGNKIVAAALGKSVGDTFLTEMGPSEFLWKIEELKHRALHLFHQLSSTFQDRFPDQSSFFMVKVVEDDLEPILRTVRRHGAYQDHLASTYDETGVPIGAIANASGRRLLDMAHSLSASGRRIHAASGQSAERELERAVLSDLNGRALVLDSLTAWTLVKLDLIAALREADFNLVVPGSALDELRALAEEIGARYGPGMTLATQGDEVVRTDHSAEDIERTHVEILEVIHKIECCADIVGTEMPDGKIEVGRQFPDLLGVQFDTISVAIRDEAVVLSLDLGLRRATRDICAHEAVGLGPLLDHLLDSGILTADLHAIALTSLACQGHGVLTLTSNLLIHAFQNDDSHGALRFAALAQHLGTEKAEPLSHIGVAAGFANLAFELLPDIQAKAATSIVLRALTRMKSGTQIATLNLFCQASAVAKVRAYVQMWARGHFLLGKNTK